MESESKWDAAIRWAIESRQFVAFTYNGVRRLAEPHIYGTKAGKRQILTWQIGGQSLSGGLPNWRRYDLDKVSDLRVIDEPFQSRRSVPVGSRDGFDFVFAAVEPIAPPDTAEAEAADAGDVEAVGAPDDARRDAAGQPRDVNVEDDASKRERTDGSGDPVARDVEPTAPLDERADVDRSEPAYDPGRAVERSRTRRASGPGPSA
jgi:hypothetical protein